MDARIVCSKPFLNLKDPDLQVMFGIRLKDSDTAAKKRYWNRKLVERIYEAGIQMRVLGEEKGIFSEDLIQAIKGVRVSTYIPKGPNRVV